MRLLWRQHVKHRVYWHRWVDALQAFKDDAHRTWVVVEDAYPIGLRIVAKFRHYEGAELWLRGNRRGVMRIWTLAEFRRRTLVEMEGEKHWIDVAHLSSTAWRTHDEQRVREAEYLARVAGRDPFAETGSMPIVGGQ